MQVMKIEDRKNEVMMVKRTDEEKKDEGERGNELKQVQRTGEKNQGGEKEEDDK